MAEIISCTVVRYSFIPRTVDRFRSIFAYKTDNSGVFADDRQHSALEQVAHQIASDITQPEVELRRSWEHHAVADNEKDTCGQIHHRLVGDEGVNVAAVMPASEH